MKSCYCVQSKRRVVFASTICYGTQDFFNDVDCVDGSSRLRVEELEWTKRREIWYLVLGPTCFHGGLSRLMDMANLDHVLILLQRNGTNMNIWQMFQHRSLKLFSKFHSLLVALLSCGIYFLQKAHCLSLGPRPIVTVLVELGSKCKNSRPYMVWTGQYSLFHVPFG